MGKSIHQRKECLMKNMEFVGFDNLNGKPGFQMAIHRVVHYRHLVPKHF